MIKLLQYNKETTSHRLAIDILRDVELSASLEQSQREKTFIEDICKQIQKSNTVLYVLKNADEILGLISLSASSIDNFPSLQVDYLFVNNTYRGQSLEVLDDSKASNYLVEFAIETAKEIQKTIGLKYVVLLPDNDRLRDIYKAMGFKKLNKQNWMFFKL